MRHSLLFLLVVLAFEAPALRAQVLYGSIVGTITDQTGAVVPRADVRAVNPQTGEVREVRADDAGRYTVGNVVPGTYEVHVTAQGFRPIISTGVTATINTVTRIDVQLQLGSQTQEINVSGQAAALQTDKSDTHTELSPHEMANLPLPNYRNFQSLFSLVPGATPPQFTNSITDTPQRPLSTNVNGTNRNNNNTRVDGASARASGPPPRRLAGQRHIQCLLWASVYGNGVWGLAKCSEQHADS
jgi:Carboxypeptidase regulatory-like domain